MQHFTTSDGAMIAYRDEGAGRPLILLHGLMAHGGFFHHQRPLAQSHRLITVDLRGHGQSRRSIANLTLARQAADVVELMERLDLDEAIGVGWSLGASVLWDILAGPASSRFAGAVVIDMTPRVLNGPDWSLGLTPDSCDQRLVAMQEDFPAFAKAAGHAIFGDAQHPEVDWVCAQFADNDAGAIAALWASLTEQDYRPILARIEHPCLIVHGALSHLYGVETAEYLADAMPNARRTAFCRSGHAPHIEQADLFNRVLADFAAALPSVTEPQDQASLQEEAHGS